LYFLPIQSGLEFDVFVRELVGGEPNDITFICLLSACSHGGLVLHLVMLLLQWSHLICRISKNNSKFGHQKTQKTAIFPTLKNNLQKIKKPWRVLLVGQFSPSTQPHRPRHPRERGNS